MNAVMDRRRFLIAAGAAAGTLAGASLLTGAPVAAAETSALTASARATYVAAVEAMPGFVDVPFSAEDLEAYERAFAKAYSRWCLPYRQVADVALVTLEAGAGGGFSSLSAEQRRAFLREHREGGVGNNPDLTAAVTDVAFLAQVPRMADFDESDVEEGQEPVLDADFELDLSGFHDDDD